MGYYEQNESYENNDILRKAFPEHIAQNEEQPELKKNFPHNKVP